MRARGTRALAVFLGVFALALLAGELVFRVRTPQPARQALRNFRAHLLTGALRDWEPRAYTVFQLPRHGRWSNSLGFLGDEWPRSKAPGVPRIVCLGGSTTQCGNKSGLPGSYPYLLELELEARTGRDFETLNAGISGWTSAEMLVSWFLTLQDLAPDVLVLHEAVNDLEPRFRTGFEPDYSHWRRPIQTTRVQGTERWLVRWSDLYVYLRLRGGKAADILAASTYPLGPLEPLLAEGKLPHATSLAFRRNITNIALSAARGGTRVALMTLPTGPAEVNAFWRYGVAENNQHLRELCAEHGFLLVDAARAFEARPDLTPHFIDMVHLEAPGNRFKAELVAEALSSWLAALPSEGARPPPAPSSPETSPASPPAKKRRARNEKK